MLAGFEIKKKLTVFLFENYNSFATLWFKVDRAIRSLIKNLRSNRQHLCIKLSALRKAPQISAIGFRQTASKLLTVVELLLGEIPERNRFTTKDMEGALKPYFELCQAVRRGNLGEFNKGKIIVKI